MNNYKALLAVLACLQLAACSLGGPTRPSEFYVLSPEPGTPVAARATAAEPLSLGIGPVALPDIFDRPQIVTRPQANQITLGEFDRWGGDLNKDLVRVLSQNLMSRLNTDNVVYFPWQRRDNPDFQVTVRFFRFDGELGRQVELSGIWQLLDGARGCQLHAQRFDIAETPAGSGYPEFVSAMSAGVARLSQDMAAIIATATPGCPAE